MKLSQTKRKFIKSYPGGGRLVNTPSGYKEIIAVHKTMKYNKHSIKLKNGMKLNCASLHVLISTNGEVYAKDSKGYVLKTEFGDSEVVEVCDLKIKEHMFDISVDSEDEVYYSSGILSHNSGKSVTTGIYLSWKYNFGYGLNIGIVANKGSSAREFLENVKNILIDLPMWMQQGTKTWNKGLIENETKMRILTDVPSADSFRGFVCHILVVDEAAWINTKNWDAFTDAIFPSQSSLAWKKNILLSTANGQNHFCDIVEGANDDESNGYTPAHVDWKEVPRFNADGTVMSTEVFKDAIVKKHGIVHFNQNYGCEFVGSTYTLISASGMKAMKPGTVEEIRDGKLRIYKPPQENHQYIMTVDASKDGEDAFAVQVVDVTDFNFEQVACADLQIDYLLMPEFLNEWCEWYNQPYLIIENNEGAGQSCADVMYQTYEYENLHFDKAQGNNKKKKYPGFRTTSKTRKQILLTMKLFVENSKLKVQDNRTIKEFQRFILINKKYQADTGAHDDMVMSLAMTFVPFCDMKNFEDMKKLVDNLYTDEPNEQNISFSELLTIGSFDSGTDEDYEDMLSEDESSEFSEHSDFSVVFIT